jgi:hypothetical protein
MSLLTPSNVSIPHKNTNGKKVFSTQLSQQFDGGGVDPVLCDDTKTAV